MQNLAPAFEAAPPGPASLRLPARLSILGVLVAAELLAISVWLDTGLLRGRGALAGMVHDWGSWSLRLGVALVLGSLIFAESRGKEKLRSISEECASHGIGWPLLGAHAAAMMLFVYWSTMLFQQSSSGNLANALVLAWGFTR